MSEENQPTPFAVPTWSALILCVLGFNFYDAWLIPSVLEKNVAHTALVAIPAKLGAIAFGAAFLWSLLVKDSNPGPMRLLWRTGAALLLFSLVAGVVLLEFTAGE